MTLLLVDWNELSKVAALEKSFEYGVSHEGWQNLEAQKGWQTNRTGRLTAGESFSGTRAKLIPRYRDSDAFPHRASNCNLPVALNVGTRKKRDAADNDKRPAYDSQATGSSRDTRHQQLSHDSFADKPRQRTQSTGHCSEEHLYVKPNTPPREFPWSASSIEQQNGAQNCVLDGLRYGSPSILKSTEGYKRRPRNRADSTLQALPPAPGSWDLRCDHSSTRDLYGPGQSLLDAVQASDTGYRLSTTSRLEF